VVEKTVSRALGGHGTSPKRRCEGSPEPSEVSSLGKLSVFSKSLIGTLGTSFITVLEMLPLGLTRNRKELTLTLWILILKIKFFVQMAR
jgi:hypothetical protein